MHNVQKKNGLDRLHANKIRVLPRCPSELAKVDASVSVLCDVHNTLVDTVLRKYASKHLQDTYLPKLSADMVRDSL